MRIVIVAVVLVALGPLTAAAQSSRVYFTSQVSGPGPYSREKLERRDLRTSRAQRRGRYRLFSTRRLEIA
jgi:hypothetical protein